MTHTTRREFLGRCTAAVAAGGMSNALLLRPAAAIEPIQRHSGPKFKFSLAAYSYRDLFRRKKDPLTLADFIDDCAKMQLEGTELTSYFFPRPVKHEYLRGLKQQAFRLGLDVSGTAVGNDFCHPPGAAREKQIAMVKEWVDYAAIMDAPVIRIFSGRAKSGQTHQQAHKLAVAAIEECCDYAGKNGVFLALENHGGLTAEADDMLKIVRDVKSPWFGVNMDTGNFRTADPYGDLAKIAPYSVNVQVKVAVKPQGGSHEPSDYKRLARILAGADYRGYIVLEYEEKGDPRTECPKEVEKLRAAFS